MRKLKEVLSIHSLGMSQQQIARSCSVSQSTVHDYVSAAEAAGAKWPLPDSWDVWQERRESNPEGYGYSRFCDLYRQWLKLKRDVAMKVPPAAFSSDQELDPNLKAVLKYPAIT